MIMNTQNPLLRVLCTCAIGIFAVSLYEILKDCFEFPAVTVPLPTPHLGRRCARFLHSAFCVFEVRWVGPGVWGHAMGRNASTSRVKPQPSLAKLAAAAKLLEVQWSTEATRQAKYFMA